MEVAADRQSLALGEAEGRHRQAWVEVEVHLQRASEEVEVRHPMA